MTLPKVIATAFLLSLSLPLAAQAQGIPGGVAHGVYEGERRAGPIGAVVGGAVGGVIGGIEGVLGVDRRYYAAEPAPYRARPPRVGRARLGHRAKHHRKTRLSQASRPYRVR